MHVKRAGNGEPNVRRANNGLCAVAASASERSSHSSHSARRRSQPCLITGAVTAVCLIIASATGCAKRNLPPSDTQSLRVSQRNEPTDLDPATASLPDEFFVIRALSEGLLTPNPSGGDPLPAAADRFDVSADGLTYTFHLRTSATWSNGEPVTAADFVASYRRVLMPQTGAPKAHLFYAVKNARAFAAGLATNFDAVGIHAPDAQTLAITLEHPVPKFPLYVTSGPWIPVNPRVLAAHGRAWTQPGHYVGNGPFTLLEWRPHQRIVVRKNERYRDAAHIRLNEIQFVRFDSPETEERAYRSGQIDVTMSIPQTKLEVYANERPHELYRSPLAETRFLSFNLQRPPLNDARVRRALALSIDREKIVTHVLKGGQTPAFRFLSPALIEEHGSTVGPDLRAGRQDVLAGSAPPEVGPYRQATTQSFDPTEARRLLAEGGFPNGDGFPKLELSGWVQNPVLDAIQQMWKQELGIDVRIAVREAKVHLAALAAGSYDIAFATTLLDVRDPVAALSDFTTTAPNNFPHCRLPEFDRLVESAERETNSAAAANDIVAAEAILVREAVVAPIYFNAQNWLMSPQVHGWQQDALWSRDYNDVWLDGR